MNHALLLQIDCIERALKAARAYRTTLKLLPLDESSRRLKADAEAQVQALEERLRAVRYQLHHPTEVSA